MVTKLSQQFQTQRRFDQLLLAVALFFAIVLLVLAGCIVFKLYQASIPSLQAFGLRFLISSEWNPVTEQFGALVAILGTLTTAFIALLLGIPISFGIAVFLTELAPTMLRRPLRILIELLAGIPSIIYGMWGLFIFAPLFADTVQPWLIEHLGSRPLIGPFFQGVPMGIGILTAGIVLSIMVIPFIASVMRDVFEIVPDLLKESAYALGATRWEVVWNVILPYSRIGVVGGIILGLGRALGETMAVAFVIGNSHALSASILMPGSSISSVLANEFTEATGKIYSSSLSELGLILFAITLVVFVCAKLLTQRLKKILLSHAFSPCGRRRRRRMRGKPEKNMTLLYIKRRLVNFINLSLATLAMLIGLLWLSWILFSLVQNGLPGFSWALFTQITQAPGGQGGLLNAIIGSLLIVFFAVIIGAPIGLLVGTYLAEFGKYSRFARIVRFVNDILLSAPSIILGLFIYQLYVVNVQHFSGWAGSFALAFLVVPIVVRITEDMFLLVPSSLREAAAALGAPRWKVIAEIVLRVSRTGVITGILLALARISGETAPLLFTALNNQFLSFNMNHPMANLPSVIFQYAMSPYADWHQLAWAGALLITACVLGLNIIVRVVFKQKPPIT